MKKLGVLGFVASTLLLCGLAALGSPFANQVPFTQPDGTPIVLWGQGDEFYAVFETLEGYTVVFSQPTQAYEYAQLSADGNQLISTGVAVGQGDPVALGLKPHVRINPEAVQQQAAERFARWDQAMGISQRWASLKAERQLADLAAAKDGPQPAPPSFTTTGAKLGLTLLIDFSDAVGTVPQAEIINFCNGDSYTGYGNNGSVKKYYLDNSNNQLTYSNVVTIYIRVPLPKTSYNDTRVDCGTEGRLLITDAINAMKALPNYATDILPLFANLTVDGSSQVLACNVFFAGNNSGVWSYGLWPHSWVLASGLDLGNGKKVYKYQITNIGTSLALGTFCHENGHMLCGFPDIYDYGYDSYGGAGVFCLMGYGGSGGNPVQISAYLKRAAGWATTVSFTSSSNLTASASASGADFNKFYRYAKPGVSTEYYLVENRQKSGRDANLPASGIAIWHVDELGNRDNQSTNFNTSHLNYELSLMQADNLWHFQRYTNSGDSKDLYYLGNTATGYTNRFSDTTAPSARWWDGSLSGINFHHFSASGATMTFGAGAEGPAITFDTATLTAEGCQPANSALDPGEVVTVNFALKNTGGGSTANLVATLLATNGVTSPSSSQTYGALAAGGAAGARLFTFTAGGSCGGICTAVFQLQDGSTNLGTINYAFTLGAVGGSVSSNYSSGGVAVTIPDNTTVEVPISITDVGAVADVNVRVRLNHTWDEDLMLDLVHPDGTVISLASARGSSGDNFGSGVTDCSGTFTVFNDSAGTAIGSGAAPFAGSYVPEQLLSTLNGKSVTGTWKLRVTDTAGGDTGTIYCFKLELTRQPYVCCSGGNAAPALAAIEGTVLSYTENAAATAITAALTVNDADSADMASGSVVLTANYQNGQDVLSYTQMGSIVGTWNSGSGTMALSGSDTVANYQLALRAVKYANSSENPNTSTRTVTFKVNDGTTDSNTQTRNITVLAVATIAGSVWYGPASTSKPVSGVTLTLTGDTNGSAVTVSDGSYSLPGIVAGGNYVVTPVKTTDSPTANGVDSFDQFLIQRHILGRTLFDSPYRRLAADVDGSGTIDSFDQFLIQRLILGRSSQFPLGLWRFVPADYVFPDANKPWGAPANRSYANLVTDLSGQDFVAIKLGDVDNSWTVPVVGASLVQESTVAEGSLTANVDPEVVFQVASLVARPGQLVKVGVRVTGFSQVASAQFTLGWDPGVLRYVGVGENGLQGGSFGTTLVGSGKLMFAWYDAEGVGQSVADGTTIFSVNFEVVGAAGSVTALTLGDSPTKRKVAVNLARATFAGHNGSVQVLSPGQVQIRDAALSGGQFQLSVPTVTGQSYMLEFADYLPGTNWVALPGIKGDGTIKILADPAATNHQRFYRVRVE